MENTLWDFGLFVSEVELFLSYPGRCFEIHSYFDNFIFFNSAALLIGRLNVSTVKMKILELRQAGLTKDYQKLLIIR